jgi:hypothetical protein
VNELDRGINLGLQRFFENIRKSAPVDVDAERHWRAADLSYRFWEVQKKMSAVLDSPGSLKRLLNCSRRLRKTSTALTKLVQTGLKKRNAMFRYVAPTKLMLRKIVRPIMSFICQDAPTDLRPVWQSQEGLYYFPSTGAELHIYGANNGHEDDARGTAADAAVIDEAQLIKNLKYVVDDVLMPQLITTGGPLWMLLTPPKTPVHECRNYVVETKAAGTYGEFDISESEYPEDVIEQFCKEAGGPASTTWLREYKCKFVVDSNYALVSEFRRSMIGRYQAGKLTPFWFKYDGMDISGGKKHKTVILFAVYDFEKGKLFVLDEVVIDAKDTTSRAVAEAVKAKEKELWGTREVWGGGAPTRIADNNNLILLRDMGTEHAVHFGATNKDTLDAMVNNVKLWVGGEKVVIDPKCEQLIGCLEYGVWDDHRKHWEESDVYGHFDGLAALMYMLRYVDVRTNPVPPGFGIKEDDVFVVKKPENAGADALKIAAALGIKKRRNG